MKYTIKTSKTIESAVEEALVELGVKEKDVKIDILEEGNRGFLGLIGAKDAAVKVTIIRDEAKMAKDFLTKILDTMNISALLNIEKNEDTLLVDIQEVDPSNVGILIGKRGNTLNAIQYLLSLAINKDIDDYLKVIVDTENYRSKREDTLVKLAMKMADKAKSSGRLVKLEPMNPYERRIIHSTLQKKAGITTYSEGEDPYRRVVIQSKK